MLYSNYDNTKYSVMKISDEYNLFRDGISKKYPGYVIGKDQLVENSTDSEIDLEKLLDLLQGVDFRKYD